MNKELGIVVSLVTKEALRFRILDLGVVGGIRRSILRGRQPRTVSTSSARIRSRGPGIGATVVSALVRLSIIIRHTCQQRRAFPGETDTTSRASVSLFVPRGHALHLIVVCQALAMIPSSRVADNASQG